MAEGRDERPKHRKLVGLLAVRMLITLLINIAFRLFRDDLW